MVRLGAIYGPTDRLPTRWPVMVVPMPSNGWFGYGVQPWIVVNAVMTVGDQRVVWRKEAEVSSFAKQLPSREANLYFRKPELFEESLRIAVRLAINELVTHLRQS